ncbi:MAG: phosphoglycerate kinase [Candidatus Terrybacteria bacterium RIFCSPLOWO2_01_FULL_58_14]|uniref:Phosphoglycerate kinase n=1 Tax=Candidatus Terrybacteria bacterium RIFCSPLOWO2_01_FULL_58_14 TaxID=1802369 RepID=A0A1G2Q2P1_9BACT|nr:MAG: phosphoglycerate kinase [Candidatus Terrybacteria bacterium RIFCSPLOWO2_01_FULL_58_14]
MLRTLDTLEIAGKRVLLRAGFDVPLKEGIVADDFRMRAGLPTFRALRNRGAKAVFVLSHLGRPKGKRDAAFSQRAVAERLSTLLGGPVSFVEDCVGPEAENAARSAKEGEVLFFENLRFHEGEEANSSPFTDALARLGDCFVNDAFSDAHRAHASIVGLPGRLPAAAGMLLTREVETLTRLRDNPVPPFVAVLGGAKISDKLPMIERLLPRLEGLCLAGALANTMLRAKGFGVGHSVVEENLIERVRAIALTDLRLHLPVDVVVSTDRSGAAAVRTCGVGDVAADELILDIGPDTSELFSRVVRKAKTVFWNGPMGIAEVPAFRFGTEAVARAVASAPGYSVVGGGDTTRYPLEMNLAGDIDFLSTGGGAMLALLAGEELPALRALSV